MSRVTHLIPVIATVLVIAALAGLVIIPILMYWLAIGPAANASGVGGLFWSVFLPLLVLVLLAPLGFVTLRLTGFAPARQKYWSVIAFLTVVGFATRLLAMVVDLSEHEFLAPIAFVSLAIIIWNGVHRRLLDGDSSRVLNKLAITLLVVTIIGMLIGNMPIPSRFFNLDGSSHLTGLVGWCRPGPLVSTDEKNVTDWSWPDNMPPDVPRKFRCSEMTEDGLDPVTLLPSIPITGEDAVKLLQWEAREEKLSKEKGGTEPPTEAEVTVPRPTTTRTIDFLINSNDVDLSLTINPTIDLTVNPGETVRIDNSDQHYLKLYKNDGDILFRLDGKGDFILGYFNDHTNNWHNLPRGRFIEFRTPTNNAVSIRVMAWDSSQDTR